MVELLAQCWVSLTPAAPGSLRTSCSLLPSFLRVPECDSSPHVTATPMTNSLQWPPIFEALSWQQVLLLDPAEVEDQKHFNLKL